MAKVTFVKAAAKDNPALGIKKGESYYWWKHRFGPKQVSKTAPTAAMTTSSEFLREAYGLNDDLAHFTISTFEDAEEQLDSLKERARELSEECRDKFDNMPEGLQQGSTGELLEGRADAMNDLADELDNIDTEPVVRGDFAEGADGDDEFNEAFAEKIEEINSEVSALSYDGE